LRTTQGMSPSRHRSLWPREHGAYVQLLAPLVAALIAAPTIAGWMIAVASTVAFVANESLLVVCGARGKRMYDETGERARRRLGCLAIVVVIVGGSGLALEPQALSTAAIALVPALIVGGLASHRKIHNLAGELAAAAALCGPSTVVLVAGGTSLPTAFALWFAWGIGYAATVIAVQHVIASHRTEPQRAVPLAMCLSAVGLIGITAATVDSRILVGAPLALASCAIIARTPAASRLRAVGIVLAAISSFGALGVGLALRGHP
jgi:YwiC-like protein